MTNKQKAKAISSMFTSVLKSKHPFYARDIKQYNELLSMIEDSALTVLESGNKSLLDFLIYSRPSNLKNPELITIYAQK